MTVPTITQNSAKCSEQQAEFIGRWLVSVAAWIPVALATLYMKYALLREGGYWATILALRFHTRSGQPDSAAFTLLQKLTFYRWDLAITFLLVPLTLLALARFLPLKLLLTVEFIVNFGLTFWMMVQRIAWLVTGRFLTLRLMHNGAWWAWRHPEDLVFYTPAGNLLHFSAVLGFSLLLAGATVKWQQARPNWRRSGLFSLLAGLAVVPTMVSFGPQLRSTVYQSSVWNLMTMPRPYLSNVRSQTLSGISDDALIQKYQKLSNSSGAAPDNMAFHGKARDFDVIIWVCETLPMRAVADRGGLPGFPNFARIAGNSLILDQHYTTFPGSSPAAFSLMTSMYPPDSQGDVSLKWFFRTSSTRRQHAMPGLMTELQTNRYETGVFLPGDSSFDEDLEMFRAAGAKNVFVSNSQYQLYGHPLWETRMQLDQRAFSQMKQQVNAWITGGHRYAAAFFPQIGHAPFENVTGLPGSPNPLQLQAALVGVQDRWFGQLLDVLKARGRMDKTLILVTGDHGIRTLKEDPTLPRAMLDEYSFHVPFMLYAPGIFSSRMKIRGLTSHIDVAPSLLDLLGLVQESPFFQGTVFWDPRLKQRRLFFLGADSVGADGLYFSGRFYAEQAISGLFFESNSMRFGDPLSDPVQGKVIKDSLQTLLRLQSEWIDRAGEQPSLSTLTGQMLKVHGL